MNWVRCADELPDATRPGHPYLVYAESADPEKPLYAVCYYWPDDPPESRWGPLPGIWSRAITHWARLSPPPDESHFREGQP